MVKARCVDCEYFMGNVGGDRTCNALNLPHEDVHKVFNCEDFRIPDPQDLVERQNRLREKVITDKQPKPTETQNHEVICRFGAPLRGFMPLFISEEEQIRLMESLRNNPPTLIVPGYGERSHPIDNEAQELYPRERVTFIPGRFTSEDDIPALRSALNCLDEQIQQVRDSYAIHVQMTEERRRQLAEALEGEQRSRNAEYFETNSREPRLPANTQYPRSSAEQQERSRTSEDIQRVTEETSRGINALLAEHGMRQVSSWIENHQRSLPIDQADTETQELDAQQIIASILTQIEILHSQTGIRPQYLLLGRKTKTALLVHLKILDTCGNRVVLTHGGSTNAHFNER